MKRALFDVVDEDFIVFLSRVSEQINRDGRQGVLVGGSAVQVHLANFLTQLARKPLDEVYMAGDIRTQDYIRATDDVDVSFKIPASVSEEPVERAKYVLEVLRGIEGEVISPSENNIFGYSTQRRGVKRPIFGISRDGETDPNRQIMMNVSTRDSELQDLDPNYNGVFIEGGETIALPYSRLYTPSLRVIRLEHLIATKMAKSRPKDVMDVANLIELANKVGRTPNREEVEHILGGNGGTHDMYSFLIQMLGYKAEHPHKQVPGVGHK